MASYASRGSTAHCSGVQDNPHALHLEAGERRYTVLEVSGEHAKDRDYFGKLYAELEGEGAEQFHAWLLGYKANREVMELCLETEEAKGNALDSLEPLEAWAVEVLVERPWKEGPIAAREAYGHFTEWLKDNRKKTPTGAGNAASFGRKFRALVGYTTKRSSGGNLIIVDYTLWTEEAKKELKGALDAAMEEGFGKREGGGGEQGVQTYLG